MNFEQQLKLQAYLDGELSASEREEVRAWIERDAEAKALVAELTWAKSALTANEPEVKVPDSREFYWSKISREIERQERAEARTEGAAAVAWWRRWLAPMGAVAAALIVAAVIMVSDRNPQPVVAVAEQGGVGEAVSDMGAITFEDHSAGVTMVWLYSDSEI
ncbi:MAG: zf-HC2 domain-containing protein [Verrucomicrobiota bacterium]